MPVVFVHPAATHSGCWVNQIPAFTADGFRCITYDLRGWHRSRSVADADPGTLSDDLEALREALQLDTLRADRGGVRRLRRRRLRLALSRSAARAGAGHDARRRGRSRVRRRPRARGRPRDPCAAGAPAGAWTVVSSRRSRRRRPLDGRRARITRRRAPAAAPADHAADARNAARADALRCWRCRPACAAALMRMLAHRFAAASSRRSPRPVTPRTGNGRPSGTRSCSGSYAASSSAPDSNGQRSSCASVFDTRSCVRPAPLSSPARQAATRNATW